MVRPSYHELNGKLREAGKAALSGKVRIVEPDSILADLLDLGIPVANLQRVLSELISEINPRKYQGTRPPKKSYENPILGCELFAFAWESASIGCRVYFKFALKEGVLWIVSLHQSGSKGGKTDEMP
jgi:hypothetical protein